MEDQTVICPFQMCIHQCFWGRLGIYESWYLYPQIVSKWYWGGNNKKKKPNFWKKLEVSTVKYMSTWCSMTYPLCQMLFSSLRLHTADRPMWRLESSSQQFASACIWGTAGSSCPRYCPPPPSQEVSVGSCDIVWRSHWDGAPEWEPWFPEAELWSYLLPVGFCFFLMCWCFKLLKRGILSS